jgi:CubicO group peptidase (beta-lactamase class C family)
MPMRQRGFSDARIAVLGGLALFVAAPAAYAQRATVASAVTTANPSEVGLSNERLRRAMAVLEAEVKAGTLPGAVLLIGRKGKIAHFETVGQLDPEAKTPMIKDGIFRIYSMSKPITSVAAMMLVEEAKISLADPVAKYIPEFADVKVGVEGPGADGKPALTLVPPRRPMTVQDLLRHTSGLTYGFFGTGLVKKAYQERTDIFGNDLNNADFSRGLATLPLMHQPGTNWEYSQSTDVLGRVVEVASGQTLYAFMKERILDPLGMKDTSFYVADKAKFPRIAEPFKADRNFGANANFSEPRDPVKYESGGGGMVGTAADYGRFLQMLLNGGTFEGKRYLSPATIAYMTSDHLGPGMGLGSAYLPGDGYGFGLGFQVRHGNGLSPIPGTAGDYAWGGAGGTAFWVDPKQDMYVVFMMQAPKHRVALRNKIRSLVYGAIVK